YEGEPVAVAGIEAIVTRAPKRAGHRIEAYAKELTAQQAAMKASFDVGLPAAFNAAFKTVTGLLAKTNEQGPAAVDRATAAALKQLAAMRRQMRTAIRSGRARTDAALVRQHDAARSQTILAHQSRAKSETAAASRRAEQDITGLRALAVAQGASGRVLIDTFAKQTDRGEKPFAKAVVTASRGFAERVAATDTDQRPRLVASAAASIASGQQQSRAAGAGLVGSATAIGTQSGATAKESADALFAQANDTSSSYDKLAQPVSKSIQGYLAPVGDAFDTVIDDLNSAADKASDSVDLYYNTGHSGEKASGAPAGSDQTSAAPAENGKAAEPPKMIPKEYMDLALKVAGDPRLDTQIKDLADKAPPEITKMVQGKAFQIHNNANELHTDTNAVMQALRSITEKQGAAIEAFFKSKFGWELEPYLRDELPKLFSMADTDELNINAAISYLHGNNVEGALNELKAAINWTNETGRIEEIARSLTPAQWAELKRLHPEVVSKVSKELDGVDRQVFDALAKEGDTAAKLGKDPTEAERADPGLTENSGKGVAEANALRLRQQIGRDRETRGDAGADKVADDVERAAGKVVTDAISGADPVAALEEHRLDKIDVTDAVAARNEKQWKDTKQGFDDLEVARTGEAAPKGAKPGWSIAAYASQKKDYWIYVPDTEYRGGYGAYGGEGGPQGHYEKKTEGISGNQTRLIQNIVDYGPDSDEAAAAHVMVELNRDGGKPKPDRLDKAMHASDLDAREGENKSKLSSDPKEDADLKKRRLDSARERQQRVLGLVGQYQNPGVAGPWDPEAVRAQVKDQLTASEAGDPSAKALVERTMRGPAASWDDEQKKRHDDAKAAFDYALAHEAERGDTLKRTFGRMDRQEITDSVDAWNAAHPGEDSLYKQLNLFSQGSWWTEKLSGDERNDVELAAKGIARNDKERAEIARFRADQQIRDAGFLGKLAGKVTGDWDRLVDSRDDIGRLMGVPPDAFDAMGNALGQGNFDENGKYTPPPGGSAAELDVALNMTHLTAEAYKAMSDSLATAVATGLVVIAAVVTTALTGGAAAAFWVTLAAGLTGMALSAAIKGNRYSRAEAE
ncbi:MAG TPA: hypothetical protein VHS81_15315, partial [Caulobacteraceae bacterium]|nr:hypothetical protein [Caulobacteraceae bacterium]